MHLKATALIPIIICSISNSAQAQEPIREKHFALAVDLLHLTEDNVGFGFNYEHFLNSNSTISLYLPFSYAPPVNKNYSFGGYEGEEYIDLSYPNTRIFTELHHERTYAKGMAYFYPGIKVYTASKMRRVSYCVGVSLLVGVGSAERNSIDYAIDTLSVTTQYLYYRRREISNTSENIGRLKLGMMVTNALNIRVNKHIYTGLELGLGYTYVNQDGGNNIQRGMLAQTGLKLGYYR